jgi:ABC-2 type transport system ATP-binding protein
VLASDTPENLQQRMAGGGQVIAEIAAPEKELRETLDDLPEIEELNISASDGNFFRCALTPRWGQDIRARIARLASERGWALRELTRSRHSLEDIYVQVTRPSQEERE